MACHGYAKGQSAFEQTVERKAGALENMGINKQSVLITGGLGNLGSWLTLHYSKRKYKVTVLTKSVRKLDFDEDFNILIADIESITDIREKVDPTNYDIIIHTASVNDGFVPDYYHNSLMVNTLGTRNFLEVLKGKFKGHFIYFSTFQVYGKYDGVITENTCLRPKNDYGNTHLFSEFYLLQFGQTVNFPYSIIRLTNSYGCPKDINSSKWYLILNDLSKMAYKKQQIVLKSNGKAVRDFIWMQEVCEITERLSLIEPTKDIFNLSGQKTFSMLEIALFVKNAYFRVYGKEINISVNNQDDTQPAGLSVKSEKIRSLLSYRFYEEKFEEEAIKIFKFLEAQSK